jgi:hypothetical protein
MTEALTPRSSAEERMVSTHLAGSSNLSGGTNIIEWINEYGSSNN